MLLSDTHFLLMSPSLVLVVACIRATTGETGMTPSCYQQSKNWWKDTTATSDQISMVRVWSFSCTKKWLALLVSRWIKPMVYFLSPPVIEGPVEIGMSLDIASIDAISEINMVHISQRQTLAENSKWINIPVNISGLHGHHLPPSEVAGLQVGVPR